MYFEDKFFITKSNLNKLLKCTEDIKINIENVYAEIYSSGVINSYLSEREAREIFQKVKFLEECGKSLEIMRGKIDAEKLRESMLNRKSIYVFAPGTKKYHLSHGCDSLRNDFINFIIPEVIRKRGDEQVKLFREFALRNRKLIADGREDVFLMRLESEFHLKNKLTKISWNNSGSGEYKVEELGTLEEVEKEVSRVINDIEKFKDSSDGLRIYNDRRYAKPMKRDFENENLLVARMAVLKNDLYKLVLRFNILKNELSDIRVNAEVLEYFGFEKCRRCF